MLKNVHGFSLVSPESTQRNKLKVSQVCYFIWLITQNMTTVLSYNLFFALTPRCTKHCILSTFQSSVKNKNPQANPSGGIRTHDLCNAGADALPLDHRASPAARDGSNTVF